MRMPIASSQLYIVLITAIMLTPIVRADLPIIDTHIHYSARDAGHISHASFIRILDRNQIMRAIVTGTPNTHTASLYRAAPSRIIPFLGVYQTPMDKERWYRNTALPEWVRQQLDTGHWAGIGELHLFADNRTSPVFRAIVKLASERNLTLQMHADPAVIDSLYAQSPKVRVIWAHASAYPYPPLLRDYLIRYPNLYIDLSVRDDLIAPDGKLDSKWEDLLLEYSDRFMVGVDTYSPNRWSEFDSVVRQIRGWLVQLPKDVALDLAYRNANRLWKSQEK
jgi:predicted TIM-barrel fold metal-dependent hydrolase